jgi:Zn-dependent peptidase ImmA (M78 family)
MQLRPPYLCGAEIEAGANALLADYIRRKGIDARPPIPVEDILEHHLGLHLGFDDLRGKLGIDDVLGALSLEDAEVIVDQTVNSDEQPSVLPRYRFTLGHEIGHWQLHRGLVLAQRRQDDLFQQSSGPSIICRTSQKRERIELQADAFAAALLMPKSEVVAHWQRLMGPERLKVSELQGKVGVFLAAALARSSHEPRTQQDGLIEFFIRPLAEAFEVSPPAMRIRLERLGFIVHDVEPTLSLFEAV